MLNPPPEGRGAPPRDASGGIQRRDASVGAAPQDPPHAAAAPGAPLGREAIAALVPHAGQMCLLERVERWDGESILCAATSHRDPGNPLRRAGRLAAVCGVEYALQAVALHGALCASGRAQPAGFLASLRGVQLHAAALDGVPGELRVSARAQARESRAFAYAFEVASAAGTRLLSGDAVIMLPPRMRHPPERPGAAPATRPAAAYRGAPR